MSTSKRMLINEGEDDEMEIIGFRTDKVKAFITYTFIVISIGFLRLFFHWVPHWYLYATSTTCPVTQAEKILVIEVFNGKHKIYHVKPLRILTSDSVLNMKTDGSNTNVVDPQLIEDLTETQPSLCVHFDNGNFRALDKLIIFSCKRCRTYGIQRHRSLKSYVGWMLASQATNSMKMRVYLVEKHL
ncbi:hypothetical protein HHI36_022713 [Cryptolaemus montrouzieri]|uniref:Cation-transporting ATPase n=1 Tax=Cryptolaemus montrouzieri TaxID=559131 RepID=A0ABD2N0R0_9CUCU